MKLRWSILVVALAAATFLLDSSVGAAEPRVRRADNGGLLVDGKPYLPIFVWAQPMKNIELLKGLGINTLHAGNDKDSPKEFLDKLQAADMLGWMNLDLMTPETVGHPAVLMWTSMHEYDSPQDPAYAPDLSGEATILWIEGEQPKEQSFQQDEKGWLNVSKRTLSGEKWLYASTAEGKAVYEFTVEKPGPYNLWVREFYKSRANPTRWTLDDREPQETPRTLGVQESKGVIRNMGVGWGKYGKVELSKGRHTLTLEVVPGRTVGSPTKIDEKLVLWAVDAICLTTADKYPPMKKADWVPRKPPSVAAEAYEQIKKADPKALAGLIFTGAICEIVEGVPKQRVPESVYKEFMQAADVITYDFYPSSGANKPYRLPQVGLAAKELLSWAPKGKPVWAFIETGQINNNFPSPTPAEMRAQIFSCVANGAKGIGYFTVAFDPFRWTNFGDGIEEELKRSNADLAALTGPIVMGDTAKKLTIAGDQVDDKWALHRAIHAIRKQYDGQTYVIAVNVCRTAVEPTFTLEGLGDAKAAVWKEDRSVSLTGGVFTDKFEPLAVHVYVIK